MSEKFNLERRADELFFQAWPIHLARQHALQLARELAEAIADAIKNYGKARAIRHESEEWQEGWARGQNDAEDLARSFARPRTREDVYREALERIASSVDCGHASRLFKESAQRALDEGAKEQP